MNRSEDFGRFILDEYDQINLLLELEGNFTGNSTHVNSFYFYENEQLAMLWILFASIVLGNSSVLIALVFDKSKTSRFNYFIKHLAIADLSVGFVSVLTDIIWKLTIEWNAGNVACKVVRYSQAVVTYSSTYLLVALTIDRYEAIRHPMNFFKSWRRAKFLVSSAWILSLLFSIPIIVLYEEKTVQGHLQCWIEFMEPWHWQMYMIIISLTVFFIPAFIIAGCYTTIIYTIWSHPNIPPDRRLQRQKISNLADHQGEDSCKRASSRGLIPKAKVKTVKMTLIIVFVFIFCWSPYIIFDLLQVFGYVRRTQTNIAVATFIQSLAPLNSAANPIIYCMFSTYICRHSSDLWEKFNRLATEMIITKAGRRMFPTLKVRLHGLEFAATYIVYMDVTLAGETRYRYNFQRCGWTVAGPSNGCVSNGVYVHPGSPARGEVWMSQENISFDKVKLTNHRKPIVKNQISLHSMHKYQPRIHVLEVLADCNGMSPRNILEYIRTHSDRSVTFAFEQTAFIAVTAYQNQQVTNLKIQSNPFAKGFREISNAKRQEKSRETRGHSLTTARDAGPGMDGSFLTNIWKTNVTVPVLQTRSDLSQ